MEAKESGRSSPSLSKSDFKPGSKDDDGSSNAQALLDFPTVTVTAVDCQPDTDALITDGLDLEIDFELDRSVEDAHWEFKYIVDSMRNRHIIILGATPPTTYPAGPSSTFFSVPSIDVSAVRPGSLTNAGLLSASLLDRGGNERFTINLVVQVQERGGEIRRTIFNPME